LIDRRAKPASVEGERSEATNLASGHRRIDTVRHGEIKRPRRLSDQKPSIHMELG